MSSAIFPSKTPYLWDIPAEVWLCKHGAVVILVQNGDYDFQGIALQNRQNKESKTKIGCWGCSCLAGVTRRDGVRMRGWMGLGFAGSPYPGAGLWACCHLLPTGRALALSVAMRAASLSPKRRTPAHAHARGLGRAGEALPAVPGPKGEHSPGQQSPRISGTAAAQGLSA